MSQAPPPISNADQLLKLQEVVGGDVTKTMSSVDTLSTLKLLNYFGKGGADLDPVVKAIAQNEIRYLSAGMQAIASSPALSARFGNGFEGAMAVSSLIKQRASETLYNSIIDKFAEPIAKDNREVQALVKGAVKFE